MIKKLFNWLLISSANPKNSSLMVRGILTGAIPWILKASFLACGIHICSQLDQTALEQIVGVLADLVFYVLSAIAAIQVVYGFCRKVYRTLNGTNRAIE